MNETTRSSVDERRPTENGDCGVGGGAVERLERLALNDDGGDHGLPEQSKRITPTLDCLQVGGIFTLNGNVTLCKNYFSFSYRFAVPSRRDVQFH